MIADAKTQRVPLISVCICTYQRPLQLEKLLAILDQQDTNGLFDLSIVVVDNDAHQSAKPVVERWARCASLPVTYRVEPRQNIAIARNTSVALAAGELVAFVDDDEEPSPDWLSRLYEALIKYGVDGVLGPVVPKFNEDAPKWAVLGQVFQRPGFKTGETVPWAVTGTGNVLIKREVLLEFDGPFNPQLGAGGEDTDFFRRATLRGRRFVWAAEAVCHEYVPPERTRVAFQLRRALLRGKIASRTTGLYGILKSAVAVFVYTLLLPVFLIRGSHVLMTYLVREFDHLGKLLATCGIDIASGTYVTEASGESANRHEPHSTECARQACIAGVTKHLERS